MEVKFGYRPMPVHEGFHASDKRERLLAGAFGSGKTYAVCAEAIKWALLYPGIRGLVTRKTVPELRDTTETVFFDLLPPELLAVCETTRQGGHYASIKFPNGSEVLFRSIDDWRKHKSLNLGFIAWDELDEFDEETYSAMMGRLRQRDPTPEAVAMGAPDIARRGSWAGTNPEGHNWVWRRFIKEDHKDREWFKSTSFDNPYLTNDYLSYLLTFPEAWVRRYVLCQFDDFAGQIYEEWSHDHIVVPTAELLQQPRVWMALDPGMRDPTAGLWVAVDRENHRLVGIAEYQANNLATDVHAREFQKIESAGRYRVEYRVADPTIRKRDNNTGMSIETFYAKQGFRFHMGPIRYDDRIPVLGNLIHRKQFVVTEACPMTFESIRDAKWRDLTPTQRAREEDAPNKPLKRNRHLCDCAEYVASKFLKPGGVDIAVPEGWSADIVRAIQNKVKQSRPGSRIGMAEGIPV